MRRALIIWHCGVINELKRLRKVTMIHFKAIVTKALIVIITQMGRSQKFFLFSLPVLPNNVFPLLLEI